MITNSILLILIIILTFTNVKFTIATLAHIVNKDIERVYTTGTYLGVLSALEVWFIIAYFTRLINP